jgi:hypothetical protein
VIFCFEKNICRELRGHRLILDVTGVAETFGNYMSETSASTVEPAEDILLPTSISVAVALRERDGLTAGQGSGITNHKVECSGRVRPAQRCDRCRREGHAVSLSNPSTAVMPLLEAQHAPYAPLLGEFRQSGSTFTQVKRVGDIAIYKQTKARRSPAFEVVTIRRREASVAFGKEFPATEYYPHNEDWGTYGFTYRTLDEAERKFEEL